MKVYEEIKTLSLNIRDTTSTIINNIEDIDKKTLNSLLSEIDDYTESLDKLNEESIKEEVLLSQSI
tara:strand:- start:387 stop:584 length:198 start_codon:yes stop_codon:yes gene_type:complete